MLSSQSKVLLIRFSSIGDVTQCLSVPTKLAQVFKEVHWVTRHDMAPLLEGHPKIDKIWSLKKESGFMGLLKLIGELKAERYSHIYDAHSSLRSRLICLFLCPPFAFDRLFDAPIVIRKNQKRWKRFLLFKFHINRFQMPFSGQRDLLEALSQWGIDSNLPDCPQLFPPSDAVKKVTQKLQSLVGAEKFVVIAPSAAFALKRWPVEYWEKLVQLHPQQKFVALGGPQDSFIEQLTQNAGPNLVNLAGKTDLQESAAIVQLSQLVIANDTGVLHLAEQMGKKAIALMGPAPFGFPSRPATFVMEKMLPCRPCSKHGQDPCRNSKQQECLVSILPSEVASKMKEMLTQ